MGTLRSKEFASVSRLDACAVSDPAHVMPGSVGPHVGKIQQALVKTNGALIDSGELAAQRYGASTAQAVLNLKRRRNILNYMLDNIVGKKTIRALDDALAVPSPVPPVPPPSPLDNVISRGQATPRCPLARSRAGRATTVSPTVRRRGRSTPSSGSVRRGPGARCAASRPSAPSLPATAFRRDPLLSSIRQFAAKVALHIWAAVCQNLVCGAKLKFSRAWPTWPSNPTGPRSWIMQH
jgi:peptidoglycan hydrolase-like protein with peptidoglycan-binding domain